MKLFELEVTMETMILELEPEEVTAEFYETALPQEAQEAVKDCKFLGLAVGMPYGFQLYTQTQWDDLRRRVNTFPSMMQRHMKPFFATLISLDVNDETGGFPQILSIPQSLARYARVEEWPEGENGAKKALLICLDDGRIYLLRADGKEEFMNTMCEQ
ncbi:MAG: hypothetical protein J6E42_06905 [Firmicutes bacterium]|nr:hypothetical protein [Bacillota bacterium]